MSTVSALADRAQLLASRVSRGGLPAPEAAAAAVSALQLIARIAASGAPHQAFAECVDADDLPASSLRLLLLDFHAAEIAVAAPPGALEVLGFSVDSTTDGDGDGDGDGLKRDLSEAVREAVSERYAERGGRGDDRRRANEERLVRLSTARSCSFRFLSQLELLGLLHAADLAALRTIEESEQQMQKVREQASQEQLSSAAAAGGRQPPGMVRPGMFGMGGDPRKRREEKVERARRQRAANEILRAVLTRKAEFRAQQRSLRGPTVSSASSNDSESANFVADMAAAVEDAADEDDAEEELLDDRLWDEEDARSFWLAQIEVAATKTLDSLQATIEEIDMLRQVEAARRQHGGRLPEHLKPLDPRDVLDGRDPNAQPMKVWSIMPNDLDKKADLRAQVFKPGWRLATMTPEEWAEEEMRRGGLPDPEVEAAKASEAARQHARERQRPGYESPDSDDEASSADEETTGAGAALRAHQHQTDDFRDANPKGWGNKNDNYMRRN